MKSLWIYNKNEIGEIRKEFKGTEKGKQIEREITRYKSNLERLKTKQIEQKIKLERETSKAIINIVDEGGK